MYGFWILVIIFGVIGVACFVVSRVSRSMYEKHKEKLYYNYETENYNGGKIIRERMFDCEDRDRKLLSEEEFNRLRKIYHKYRFWYNMYFNIEDSLSFIGLICIALAILFVFPSILAPINAAEQTAYWQEFKPMAEKIIADSTTGQSLGITDEVIEYNTWLAKARSSQEIWKNWSVYHNIDLSSLDYITIGGN